MITPWKKIITKYVIFLVMIGILPLLVIGFSAYHLSSQTLQAAESRFAQAQLSDQINVLKVKLAQVESLIANISGVETITQALDDKNRQTDAYTDLATKARIGYILNGYLHMQGLVSIDIFTEGGNHYHVGDTLNVGGIREDVKSQIRKETMQHSGQVYWAGVMPNVNQASSYRYVLSAAQIFRTTDRQTLEQRPTALVIVNYSLAHIYDDSSRLIPSESGQTVLLDQKQSVLYSNNPETLGRSAEGLVRKIVDNKNSAQQVIWENTPYLVHSSPLPALNWQILSITPEQVLLRDVHRIREVGIWLMILGVSAIAFAAWFFSRNIVNPIREVISGYQRLQTNSFDLDQRLPVRSNDEVGELVVWFNRFLDNLNAQQASEEALRESEERYALVAKASNEGLWDWNLITNEMYFSPRFFSLIGQDPNALSKFNRAEDWFKLIHPDDKKLVQEKIESYLAGLSSDFQCEYRLLRHDGTYLWVLSHGLAVRNEAAEAVRMAGSHTDISARKAAENQLRHDAFHDELTGLYNRAWLISYLQQLMSGLHRKKDADFAILFLDLDQFKIVNDSLGHAAGDDLLIQVSSRLKTCLRDSDLLSRFGGDEFVILLEHSDNYHFIQVAKRIIEALSKPFKISKSDIQTGVSIGITFSSSGYTDPYEILRDADIAMYQAKAAGKNCHVVFDENMRTLLLHRLTMEQNLSKAINNDLLSLHFQPIISLANEKLAGFETLVRWNDPELGMIGPDEFIPLAESCNLINPLGAWVFDQACQQWQSWKNQFEGIDSLVLSINLSAMQFHDTHFLDSLPEKLKHFGMKGSELAIEITETAIIHETDLAAKVLDDFDLLGIHIYLDDFGTGYSSLRHLAEFPINLIKIDRSFVQKIPVEKKQIKMVRGLINLAHELGIECTAEGIENCEQQTLLSAEKCDYGQGYYIAKPTEAKLLEQFIGTHLTKKQ